MGRPGLEGHLTTKQHCLATQHWPWVWEGLLLSGEENGQESCWQRDYEFSLFLWEGFWLRLEDVVQHWCAMEQGHPCRSHLKGPQSSPQILHVRLALKPYPLGSSRQRFLRCNNKSTIHKRNLINWASLKFKNLLLSERHYQTNERTSHILAENISKLYIW